MHNIIIFTQLIIAFTTTFLAQLFMILNKDIVALIWLLYYNFSDSNRIFSFVSGELSTIQQSLLLYLTEKSLVSINQH